MEALSGVARNNNRSRGTAVVSRAAQWVLGSRLDADIHMQHTCLARCRCPQLECYWWVMALTKHHHHSSFIWSVAKGWVLHSFVGIFKLQLKRNKTMRNIDIKYQSNLLKKTKLFHLFSTIRIPNPNRNRVNCVIECYCQNKYQLIWMGSTDNVCVCVCVGVEKVTSKCTMPQPCQGIALPACA